MMKAIRVAGAGLESKSTTSVQQQPPAPGRVSQRLVIWLWALVRRGAKRHLEPEDIPDLTERMKSASTQRGFAALKPCMSLASEDDQRRFAWNRIHYKRQKPQRQ